jgi:hypothetical protein
VSAARAGEACVDLLVGRDVDTTEHAADLARESLAGPGVEVEQCHVDAQAGEAPRGRRAEAGCAAG